MRSVAEALHDILSIFNTLSTENVPLADSLGRVLATPVIAENDLPPFANTSMDGYAVQAADLAKVPVRLQVVGDVPAGSTPDFTLERGQAARIMTGAALPNGTDTIVPVEATDQDRSAEELPSEVEIRETFEAGAHIRPQGEDVRVGEQLLSGGHVLRPQDLGLLAGLGIAQVPVVERPLVAIVSTGDELLPPDAPLSPGKIRDMNSYSLPAMIQTLCGRPLFLGRAADTHESVRKHLQRAIDAGAHLIISSAGVSVGARDVVKAVVDELGGMDFWRVRMRPGKPLAFGTVGDIPFLGLPGNPVSALATFEIFARPAILKMLGQDWRVPEVIATVGEDMTSDGRESYIRVTLRREADQLIATSTGTQSSGAISSLVKADALLVIPAGVEAVAKGEKLNVRPFAGQSLIHI